VLVAGVDSSTQSCKVVLCDADDGTILAAGSAPHPDGTECDPAAWWAALQQAGDGLLGRAAAVGVAGQQHGMIVLDEAGAAIRPALLWNDLRSAGAAADLVTEMGGPEWWATQTGSVPAASFTITKLRWLAEHEQVSAARAASVMLPHDWLTWMLCRDPAPGSGHRTARLAEMVTDRGDASGTGYFAPSREAWLPDLASAAIGHPLSLPRVAGPAEVVGETAWGTAVSAGTGDNMAAALGLGLEPGDLAVSVGTSGTAFAVSEQPAADASGAVCGFADATGRFLPLVCTVNAGLVMRATAALLGVDLAGLDALALAAPPGAQGLVLLPYLDGERTPSRPSATGVVAGLTTRNASPQNMARAVVEAVLASLAEAADLLAEQGVARQRVLLIGGGARSPAVCAIAPTIFGVPVVVPEPAEYVALGAARQAAWALAGGTAPPAWPPRLAREYADMEQPEVRQRYAALREKTACWP
jgi:xylulokinase